MNVITSKSLHDSSFSFSRRYFHWKNNTDDDEDDDKITTTTTTTTHSSGKPHHHHQKIPNKTHHYYNPISKLKSALSFTTFLSNPTRFLHRQTRPVIGTIFGRRRGHVRLAFQAKPNSKPCFLIELATPTSLLIREMASGLVRIALECEKKTMNNTAVTAELLAEPRWRAYCNGRKCGYANNKRECIGDDVDDDYEVLKAVAAVTVGAGVLPAAAETAEDGNEAGGSDGEVMYMRAKFERVVGSTDSEAFYMMNPDHHHHSRINNNSYYNSGPELSIYLLRV